MVLLKNVQTYEIIVLHDVGIDDKFSFVSTARVAGTRRFERIVLQVLGVELEQEQLDKVYKLS